MNKINYIILIFTIVLGSINKYFISHIEFISSYGNDLLALPLLLSFSSILLQNQVKLKYGIILWIIGSILSEFIRPIFDLNSVSDLWDILAYFVGMMIYYGIIYLGEEK